MGMADADPAPTYAHPRIRLKKARIRRRMPDPSQDPFVQSVGDEGERTRACKASLAHHDLRQHRPSEAP